MQVTGPFTLTANEVLNLQDPTPNGASVAVQLQNMSGFPLNIADGYGSGEVLPNYAATFPCSGGQVVQVTVGPSGSTQQGLYAVWLYPWDQNPQQDGQMQATQNVLVYNMTTGFVTAGASPVVGQVLIAAPATPLSSIVVGQVSILNDLGTFTFTLWDGKPVPDGGGGVPFLTLQAGAPFDGYPVMPITSGYVVTPGNAVWMQVTYGALTFNAIATYAIQ